MSDMGTSGTLLHVCPQCVGRKKIGIKLEKKKKIPLFLDIF